MAIRVEATPVSSRQTPEELDLDDLQTVVDVAIDTWADAGVSAGELDRLREVSFSLTDLAGANLAIASASAVQIDVDAAGYGWFVDATPEDNDEFIVVAPHELVATGDSPAHERVDLLTVVLHEMGHILGLGHGAEGTLMDDTLPLGTRRVLEDLDWLAAEPATAQDTDVLTPATVDEALKEVVPQ
jgi:hypothetical protein